MGESETLKHSKNEILAKKMEMALFFFTLGLKGEFALMREELETLGKYNEKTLKEFHKVFFMLESMSKDIILGHLQYEEEDKGDKDGD